MAKRGSTKKEFEFSDISSFLSEVNPMGGLIDEASHIGTTEWIHSGNYILNALLSGNIFGGFANNRMYGVGGLSGTGKTFLFLNTAIELQKAGYHIIWIDSEGAMDAHTVHQFGMDPKKFRIEPIGVVEDLKIYMAKVIQKFKEIREEGGTIPKLAFVIDSLGNLASRKEVMDAQEAKEKADMTRAKIVRSLFRIIRYEFGLLRIPIFITNHTYIDNSSFFPTQQWSGGEGGIYNCDTIMMLTKAKLKTGEEDEFDLNQSGIVMTIKTVKNRQAKPKQAKIHIDHTKGCNPYIGLEDFCTPENFEQIGIGKGKYEMNPKTGNMEFTEGGNYWYVRHLDKKVSGKNLHTSRVFTREVLELMEPVLAKYFKYSSIAEIEETEKNLDQELIGLLPKSSKEDEEILSADELFAPDNSFLQD